MNRIDLSSPTNKNPNTPLYKNVNLAIQTNAEINKDLQQKEQKKSVVRFREKTGILKSRNDQQNRDCNWSLSKSNCSSAMPFFLEHKYVISKSLFKEENIQANLSPKQQIISPTQVLSEVQSPVSSPHARLQNSPCQSMYPPPKRFQTQSIRFPYDKAERATSSLQELRKKILASEKIAEIKKMLSSYPQEQVPSFTSSQPQIRYSYKLNKEVDNNSKTNDQQAHNKPQINNNLEDQNKINNNTKNNVQSPSRGRNNSEEFEQFQEQLKQQQQQKHHQHEQRVSTDNPKYTQLSDSFLLNEIEKWDRKKRAQVKKDQYIQNALSSKVQEIYEEKANKPHIATLFINDLKSVDEDLERYSFNHFQSKRRYNQRLKTFHHRKYSLFHDFKLHTAQLEHPCHSPSVKY